LYQAICILPQELGSEIRKRVTVIALGKTHVV